MKLIREESMMTLWKNSPSFSLVYSYLLKMSKEVEGCSSLKVIEHQQKMPSFIFESFKKMMKDIREFNPPVNSSSTLREENHRFGNPLFKIVLKEIEIIYDKEFGVEISIPFVKELFINSFGDSIRIDYGTGHELTFLSFLTVLDHHEILPKGEGILFFKEYLLTSYNLQDRFKLEPAGSHGVFGLDDYHHIPFILGASQMIGSSYSSISLTMNRNHHLNDDDYDNFYSIAINRIFQKKKGPFHEHSPILYDISGIENWSIIFNGLLKMYKGEVMGKYPIVQHFLFGDCLSL